MKNGILKLLPALLLICMGFAGQVGHATADQAQPQVLIYVVPAISDTKTLPTSSISSAYVSNEISMTACAGEYQPGSFVIWALTDITALKVRATDLIAGGNVISSGNVDIRVVKDWYQRGDGNDVCNVSDGKFLTPELLLKDDSLVKVDGGENYVWNDATGGYTWISDPTPSSRYNVPFSELSISDTDSLQPVNIAAQTNKQFWITVKVPDGQAPGVYAGTIELTIETSVVAEIRVRVEVLPFSLAQPYLTYGLYYWGEMDASSPGISTYNKTEEQFRADLINMLEHGLTDPALGKQWNDNLFALALTIRQELGMANQPLFLGYRPFSADNPPQTAAELETVKASVREIVDMAKSYGVTEVYFYGIDEATGYLLTAERPALEAIHEAGGKVWVAGYKNSAFQAVGDLVDLFLCAEAPSAEEAALWHSVGHEIFCYANPQAGVEKPETYRRNFGLLLWQNDYDGTMNFAYQYSNGTHPWNDFDDPSAHRDHNFTYPTNGGVIDTIEWEGWREGVDDVRYLSTLLKAIHEAKAAGKDTSAAENWLAELKRSDLAMENLDAVRSRMIGYILSFVAGSPLDVTPPVITSIDHSAITSPLATMTITWTTDERATSQVEYGTTTGLGLLTDLDTSLEYTHEVTLTGLNINTTYYSRVKSSDASHNLAVSDIYSFNTLSSILTSLITPTDADNAVLHRNWTDVNVSVDSTYEASSFINWNHSLVGYWNCNENTGSVVHDKSSYGNNGTLKNGPQWTNGKFGSALAFDGIDDYVDLGNSSSLNTNGITIEAWVKLAKLPSDMSKTFPGYFGKTDAFTFYWDKATNQLVWKWRDSLGANHDGTLVSKTIFEKDKWYHLVYTFDGAKAKGYVNGLLEAEEDYIGTLSSNPNIIRIGKAGEEFQGLIDEVRIWNRALSPEEIRASYNTNVNGLSQEFTSLADGTYQYYAYTTDLTGNSTQTETRTITVNTTVIPGDANGDGKVNTADLTVLERIIAGLQSPTPGADANQDSRTNTADITQIERLISGISG